MPWSVASRCRCQSVSVSVGSAQFIAWWYAVGSGLGLVWTKRNSRPSLPTPGRNPLTRDPWTSTHRLPLSLPPSSLLPGVFPRFLLPAVCLPRSACRLLGLDLGDPVTRQAFPHIIKRLCFAAFLGLGLCGLLRLHRPRHLHSPNLLASPSPSRAAAAWATPPTNTSLG